MRELSWENICTKNSGAAEKLAPQKDDQILMGRTGHGPIAAGLGEEILTPLDRLHFESAFLRQRR
jgi:hypothetical protein